MTRGNISRAEAQRIAAEKVLKQKQKEAKEEREYYKRITSGTPWMVFKSIVFFCSFLLAVSLIEHFVDGPTKKISDQEWKYNREWEWTWHKVLDVEGYMFSPMITDWINRADNSLEITYTPIFRSGKIFSFDVEIPGYSTYRVHEIRQRSTFVWFPAFQILLLIPILTYLFRRQKPWFHFARLASLYFVFPASVLVLFFAML